ncbi:hypothetical protein L1987_06656 [Smallanthus sonchifolius]|uniref:Uncharacterized protein n=1 Tax=Smallanthus sonchifolius TaxID=185202 RepID=A0ACB9JYQ1_9ASTR|nr:hypothetical protein L1987_06656 [Smallanthus sonchifolius]
MTGNIRLLEDVKNIDGGYVAFVGNKGGYITGHGTLKNDKVKFEKVNYVELLEHNLLSVSQVCDKKFSFHFNDAECYILKPGFVIPDEWILMKAPRTNDTYVLDMSVATTTNSIPTCLLSKASESDSILWHRKLAHINYRKMNYTVKNDLVFGIPRMKFSVPDDCIPCKKGKQRKKSQKSKSKNSIVTPLELLHMDLFGPISIRSIGGKSYCLVVTDDFSRFSWVKFLSSKSETTELVQYLILGLENLFNLKVRRIRSDNGSEFKNSKMGLFCLQKGIHHEFRAPYVPQQNGVAERKNRTLVKTARTMLADSKLPVTFWAEAVNTACHVLNRVLTVKQHNKTCYELLNNRKPNLDYLLPFAVVLYGSCQDAQHNGFLLNTVPNSSVPSTSAPDPNVASCSGPQDSESEEDNAIFQILLLILCWVPEVASIKELKDHPVTNITGNLQDGVKTRSLVDNTCLYTCIKDSGVLDDCSHSCFISQVEPKNVEMALNDNNWIETMQEELTQFDKLKVWNFVDLPKGVYPIGTKWVFKCMKDGRGVVVRNKARLVVQGFNQQEGIDYTEVFAPVARLEDIRLFLAFASYKDPLNPNMVFKLDKALYGLHQAPRAWYETLSTHLLSNDFVRGKIDSTLFIKKSGGDYLLVQIYVDDIIFGSKNEGLCKDFESVMKSKFEMSTMGELSFFLGLQVNQKEDGFFIHQSKYVKDILSRFKMEDCTPYDTPIPVNHKLNSVPDGKDVDCRLYRAMIGSLMKSTTGGCQFLGNRLVSWQCKKQTTVSISTCEAEYIAAPSCCSQILSVRPSMAPRAWYETLSTHLLSNDFVRGKIDSTLFIKKSGGDYLLVQIYVDDIIFGSKNEGLCKDFESVMKSKFEMSTMGELSFFLGLQVNQKEDGFFIHQSKYVKDILSRFKMEDCTPYDTPIPVNHKLNSDPDGKDVDCRLYRAMIGSLMKSTTGGCQFLGNRLVSWQCKKQTTVSISTCEAEYIAAPSCCSQILHLIVPDNSWILIPESVDSHYTANSLESSDSESS